jgi:FSR family fosmidomycin resistance protein-like MFS transporter
VSQLSSEPTSQPNRTAQFAVTLAHITVDMHTGSLAILLPALLVAFDLNYALAASIFTANNIVIAIAQPLFGTLGDAKSYRWMVWFGCALTGVAMVSIMFLPNYWLVIAAVMLSGIGSAMFHPEAISRVRAVSGTKVTSGVSLFFSGGNIGFALGPFLATFLATQFGKAGEALMLLPTLLALIFLATQWKVLSTATNRKPKVASVSTSAKVAVAGLVAFLMLIIILRSSTLKGLETFIPLYYTETTNLSQQMIANLVTTLSLAGVIGTLLGGVVADRIGRRLTMGISMVISLAGIYGFLNTTGLIRFVLLFITGAFLTAAWPIIVVMIQEAMPNNVGLASGLSLGTAYGAQAIVVQLLGVVADQRGLETVMTILSLLPVGVLLLTFFVPEKVSKTSAATS